jgi:hypothetical protein
MVVGPPLRSRTRAYGAGLLPDNLHLLYQKKGHRHSNNSKDVNNE